LANTFVLAEFRVIFANWVVLAPLFW